MAAQPSLTWTADGYRLPGRRSRRLYLAMHDGEADADAAGDLAQGLAFGAASEDRAPVGR